MKKYIKAAEDISSMDAYEAKFDQVMLQLSNAMSEVETQISVIYDAINQFYSKFPEDRQFKDFSLELDNPDNYPWFMSISDEDAESLYSMWDAYWDRKTDYETLVDGVEDALNALDEAYNRIADFK